MAALVLDSWALLAFFKGEPAAAAVETLLQQAASDKTRLLLCVVNWGEIWYGMCRAGGPGVAEAAVADLAQLPIDLVPADLALTRQAAIFKSSNKISLADAYAAALAKTHHAVLATGDLEFSALAREIKIKWLK
jgi:predicted nucleic acid-binding protein